MCYEIGMGVVKSELKVILLYEWVCNLNFMFVYIDFGICYIVGYCVDKNFDFVIYYWIIVWIN